MNTEQIAICIALLAVLLAGGAIYGLTLIDQPDVSGIDSNANNININSNIIGNNANDIYELKAELRTSDNFDDLEDLEDDLKKLDRQFDNLEDDIEDCVATSSDGDKLLDCLEEAFD